MTEERALYEKELREKLNSAKDLDDYGQALRDRLNGRLTTLDIAGHTFYVDFAMQRLRPKDDFSTLGIKFDDLDYHFNVDLGRHEIPYNKKKHQLAEIDLEDLTEIPKDVVVIAFPEPCIMDPVGYSRASGWDLEKVLEESPQKRHFTAIELKGDHNFLEMRVKENRSEKNLPPLKTQNKSRKLRR